MANKILYQQGTQRIEVVVRKEVSGGQQGAKEKDTEEISSNDKGQEENGGVSTEAKRLSRTTTLHLLTTAKQVANSTLDYIVSGIGLESGDQALQEQVSRQVEIYKDASGVAMSVGMGALGMSWAGPWGWLIGGSLGAISSSTSLFFKYRSREREYNYNIFKENNAIQYQRARANINLTTGRLR